MKVNGIDEEPALEIVERNAADQRSDESFEGFPTVQGRGEESAERHIRAGYLEDIPAPDQPGSRFHLMGRHPRSPCRGDERSDTRANHQIGNQTPLFERPEHADVGEPFQATTT
jgi:hypothetical protein